MATILTKKSDTSSSVPLAADLTNAAGGAELAVNTADKRLYSKTSGGTVVELGTNPSTLSLPNGTANGVLYLSGSKVLTSGSALTFDGTNLGVGGAASSFANYSTVSVNNTNGGIVNLLVNGTETARMQAYSGVFNIAAKGASTVTAFEVNGSEQMRLTSTGLGIGTSSVNYGLTLNKNGLNTTAGWFQNAVLADASGNRGLFFGYDTSGNNVAVIGANSTGAASSLQFWTFNGSTWGSRLNIDSSGNLLVGTTSSFGPTRFVSASGGRAGYFQTSSTTNTQDVVNIAGTGSASSYNGVRFWYGALDSGSVVGSISFTSVATTYNTTSDYRLKTVLGSITDSGTRLDALEPIEYEWKADGSRTRGFLAHKFQEVYAGSVTGSKDAVDKEGKPVYQAMQAGSSEVIADLVAEIQSLRKRLASLESK